MLLSGLSGMVCFRVNSCGLEPANWNIPNSPISIFYNLVPRALFPSTPPTPEGKSALGTRLDILKFKTVDITMRLWGINPTNSVAYFPEPRVEVYCLTANFKISKSGY